MRKIAPFLTLLLALFLPASAQTTQYLRFKIVPDDSTHVDGNPSYPGTSSSGDLSTPHSFTVTSNLEEGFTLEVDPNSPEIINTTGTPFVFQLGIFIDGQWVADLNLGNLGSSSSSVTVADTDLPLEFDEGRQIVLSGGYLDGTNYIPVTIRWYFDENGANYKEVRGEPLSIQDPGPEFYKPFAFNYQPSALGPQVNFITEGTGYKTYDITGPAPVGYTDPIAANYGTNLLFQVGTREGIPLASAISTMYYDQNENGVLDDPPLNSFAQLLAGPSEIACPLDDPASAEERLYFLRVEATNVFNLTTQVIVPITSLRALEWPEGVTWDLDIIQSGGGVCTYDGFTTYPETVSQQTVHYTHVPPCNNPQNANDLIVELINYGDPNDPMDYDPNYGINFDVRLLLSTRSGCSPIDRHAKTPGGGVTGTYTFQEVENNFGTPGYVWGMQEASPYPSGDYVEVAIVEMVDTRSGKKLSVEGLDISNGGVLGRDWPYNRPKHRLRLVGDSSSSTVSCETFDFAIYDVDCANEISELDFVSSQNLAFWVNASLPPEGSPYDHDVWVVDADGAALDFTLLGDVMTNPTSSTCYPFQVQINETISGDFTIHFRLTNNQSISVAREIYVNLTTPPAGPEISGISYETAGNSVELDGTVNFYFEVNHNWTGQPTVLWRWHNTNGKHWLESGEWSTAAGVLAAVGGSDFSGHWTTDDTTPGITKIHWNIGSDFSEYIANFFDSLSSQPVTLEVELTFPDGQTASGFSNPSEPFIIKLQSPNSLGSALVGYEGIPGEFETITYNKDQQDLLRFVLGPQAGTELDISQVRFSLAGGVRRLLDGNFDPPVRDGDNWVLTGPTGFLDTLGDEGVHALNFYPDNSGDGKQVILHAIAPQPVLVRYHLRDHLGSSALTQTFRSFPAHVQNAADFSLAGTSFYDHGYSETRYEPFGERLNNNVADELKARYTDHEFDGTTGFTYMKGRFQLANYAKFNRPDPMRDWDWLSPHTINLYEYVSNDPINAWDPTGFGDDDFWKRLGDNILQSGAFALGTANALFADNVGVTPSNVGAMRAEYRQSAAMGQAFGHILAAIQATYEITSGITGLGGSGLVTIGSVGTATPVTAPVAIGSTLAVGHGSFVMHNAMSNLSNHNIPESKRVEGAVSPDLDPNDFANKTPDEIHDLAIDSGLEVKGPNAKAGRGSYIDPVTKKQRVLIHDDHMHVNNPSGERLNLKGEVVSPEAPEAHLDVQKPPPELP